VSHDDRERYLERIGELFERASYRQALSVCDRALTVHPACAEAHDYRGLILCRMGRYREALPSYDQAIRLEPDYVPALLDKAELLVFYLHDSVPALALADRVLRLQPSEVDQAHAAYVKGVAWANLDDHDEALINYELSLSWDPDYPDAHCERGVSLFESYRFGEALKALKFAIELDPRHARPHHYLGCLYEFMGEGSLSRRCLDRAAELDPESYPQPLRLSEEDFLAVGREALHTLPREVARMVRGHELTVAELPDRMLLADRVVRPSAPLVLLGDPKRLVLHQRNLERACRSRGELVEETAHAICHACGHPELS
jgi:tetratricopeptide (TPR) repeat protein